MERAKRLKPPTRVAGHSGQENATPERVALLEPRIVFRRSRLPLSPLAVARRTDSMRRAKPGGPHPMS